MDQQIYYRFKTTTPLEYELLFKTHTETALFEKIFKKSKRKIKRAIGQDVNLGIMQDMEGFEIPCTYYFFLLNVALKEYFSYIARRIGPDGYRIATKKIESAIFYKDKENKDIWHIYIIIKGKYARVIKKEKVI